MWTPIETRGKCPEFKDTTPFIVKSDIIIMHMLEHSALARSESPVPLLTTHSGSEPYGTDRGA